MIARVLQWTGLVALLGLAGFGVSALLVVKDRIHITVQDASTPAPADPLALVRDDLQQLHRDLEAIGAAMNRNLGEVGRLLGEQQAAGEKLQTRLTSLERAAAAASTVEVRQALQRLDQRLEQRLDQLRAAVARARAIPPAGKPQAPGPATGVVAVPPKQDPAREQPVVQKPAVQPTAEQPTPAKPTPEKPTAEQPIPAKPIPAKPIAAVPPTGPTKTDPAAGRAAPRGGGFLTFQLPSQSFSFTGPQHFRILPSLSRVGFDAKSTLHDFTGVTSKIRGDLYADLSAAEPGWRGTVSCDAASLNTGSEGRDEAMREHLATKQHPRIEFQITGVALNKGGVDLQKQRAAGVVQGRMTIRGKTRPLSMPVTISVDESRRILIEGQGKLKLTDHEVPVPSKLGLISMEDEVKVWISLRARSIGKWNGKD